MRNNDASFAGRAGTIAVEEAPVVLRSNVLPFPNLGG